MTKRRVCPQCGLSLKFSKGRPVSFDKRRAISMRKQGFKIKEIAKILRCSIGSVGKAVKGIT